MPLNGSLFWVLDLKLRIRVSWCCLAISTKFLHFSPLFGNSFDACKCAFRAWRRIRNSSSEGFIFPVMAWLLAGTDFIPDPSSFWIMYRHKSCIGLSPGLGRLSTLFMHYANPKEMLVASILRPISYWYRCVFGSSLALYFILRRIPQRRGRAWRKTALTQIAVRALTQPFEGQAGLPDTDISHLFRNSIWINGFVSRFRLKFFVYPRDSCSSNEFSPPNSSWGLSVPKRNPKAPEENNFIQQNVLIHFLFSTHIQQYEWSL